MTGEVSAPRPVTPRSRGLIPIDSLTQKQCLLISVELAVMLYNFSREIVVIYTNK